MKKILMLCSCAISFFLYGTRMQLVLPVAAQESTASRYNRNSHLRHLYVKLESTKKQINKFLPDLQDWESLPYVNDEMEFPLRQLIVGYAELIGDFRFFKKDIWYPKHSQKVCEKKFN